MVATINMKSALEKSTSLEKVIPEKRLRCSEPFKVADGGGINVSTVIKKLGSATLPCLTPTAPAIILFIYY